MILICAGRPVRRFDNRVAGAACGTTYDGPVDSARVIGWRVGPPGVGDRPAMCPACARPGVVDDDEDSALMDLVPLPGL